MFCKPHLYINHLYDQYSAATLEISVIESYPMQRIVTAAIIL